MSCVPDYVDASWSFYRYEPSMAATVIFIILFIATTALHAFQMIKVKTWYLTAFCIGGLCECIMNNLGNRELFWIKRHFSC